MSEQEDVAIPVSNKVFGRLRKIEDAANFTVGYMSGLAGERISGGVVNVDDVQKGIARLRAALDGVEVGK